MKTLPLSQKAEIKADVNTSANINKQLMIVSIVAIGGFFTWRVIKKYMDNASTRMQAKALEKEYTPNQNNLTINQSQAALIAQKLYVAMNGMGTDSKTILDLLVNTTQTPDDLKLIVKTFGIKEYGTTGSPYWGKGTPCDLTMWLRNELSGSDLKKVQTRFNEAGIIF